MTEFLIDEFRLQLKVHFKSTQKFKFVKISFCAIIIVKVTLRK